MIKIFINDEGKTMPDPKEFHSMETVVALEEFLEGKYPEEFIELTWYPHMEYDYYSVQSDPNIQQDVLEQVGEFLQQKTK